MSVTLLNRAVEAALSHPRINVKDVEAFADVVRKGGGVSPDELAAFQALATRYADRFDAKAKSRHAALARSLALEPAPAPPTRPAAPAPAAPATTPTAPAAVNWTDFSVASSPAAVAGPRSAEAAKVEAALSQAVAQGLLPKGDDLLLASAVAQLNFGEEGARSVILRLATLSAADLKAFGALRGTLDTPLKRTTLYAVFSAGTPIAELRVFAKTIAPATDAQVEKALRSNGSEQLAKSPAPVDARARAADVPAPPRSPLDAAAQAQRDAVLESEGFTALTAPEQQRLRTLVGGANAFISAPARKALDALVRQPAFVTVSAPAQAEALRTALRDEAYLPRNVGVFSRALPAAAAPAISGPVEIAKHLFIAKRGTIADLALPAQQYTLSLDGRAVQVFVPKQPLAPGEVQRTPEAVARALAALPKASRDLVKVVNLQAVRNPEDAQWEARFGTPGFRSAMSASASGVVDLYPIPAPGEDEALLVAGLTHETGHVLSRSAWGEDQNDVRWFPWKAAAASDGISPSGYGRENWLEDFSEAYLLAQMVRGTPQEPEVRAMMPARMALIDQLTKRERS